MKKKFCLIVLLFICACCLFAKKTVYTNNSQLGLFISELDSKRESMVQPKNYFSKLKEISKFPKEYYDVLSEKEIFNLMTIKEPKLKITYQQAVDDVDILFRMLKYSTARYDMMGGDPVYNKAKEKIFNNLESYKSRGSVSVEIFAEIMAAEFGFVLDNHFQIGNHRVFYEHNNNSLRYLTWVSNLYFDKDDNGYYLTNEKTGDKTYFVSCDNPDVLMVPFLKEDGSFTNSLILYCPPDRMTNYDVVQMSDGNKLVFWNDTYSKRRSQKLLISEFDNVAYVDLRDFGGDEAENQLPMVAKQAKKKDVVILDLRDNGGIHYYNFLPTFLGGEVYAAQAVFARRTCLNHYGLPKGEEYIAYPDVSNRGKTSNKNKSLLVVLVNNNSGCATEEFMQTCRYINNCVIIGTNTKGHLDGGSDCCSNGEWDSDKYDLLNRYLPNSGLMVRADTSCSLYDDYEDMVGKGFLPDIFVGNTDSMVIAVANLLAENGYISSETAEALKNY